MYADKMTDSMQAAIEETNRRREKQMAYNEKHGITPTTIKKEIRDVIRATYDSEDDQQAELISEYANLSKEEKQKFIDQMEEEMRQAAKELDFEKAMELRDALLELKVEG